MCGLAGFARHPDGANAVLVHEVGEALLLAMQSRGRHATGIAAFPVQGPPLTWKRAAAADIALRSPEWEGIRRNMPACTITIGHTRHATHANAHLDDCAHPFTFGDVTGAHNGIIDNWRELQYSGKKPAFDRPFQVDSEAAFALLNKHQNPVKALDKLDGYWALTWVRDGKLHMCRTPEAPLVVAYAPELRALFWASLKDPMVRILRDAGVKYEVWEAKPGTVYTYDPMLFTADTTGVVKVTAPFRGRTRDGRRVDPRTNGGSTYTSRFGGGSAGRSLDRRSSTGGGHQFDAFNAAYAGVNGGEPSKLERAVTKLRKENGQLADRVESLEGQVRFLLAALAELGIKPPAPKCDYCGHDGGELVPLPHGGMIHDACILDQLREEGEEAVASHFDLGPAMLNVGL